MSLPGKECAYSFADLFMLARKRTWTEEERAYFAALDQTDRNHVVRQLAAEAGNVVTEDKIGSDGTVYTAFWVDVP